MLDFLYTFDFILFICNSIVIFCYFAFILVTQKSINLLDVLFFIPNNLHFRKNNFLSLLYLNIVTLSLFRKINTWFVIFSFIILLFPSFISFPPMSSFLPNKSLMLLFQLFWSIFVSSLIPSEAFIFYFLWIISISYM